MKSLSMAPVVALSILAACGDIPSTAGPTKRVETAVAHNIQPGSHVGTFISAADGYTYPVLHYNPPTAGNYFATATHSAGMVRAQTGVYHEQWVADTLFDMRVTSNRYGSSGAGCDYTIVQPLQNTYFDTIQNGCYANWIEVGYSVTKTFVQTPFSAYISGPTSINTSGNYTWSSNPSGGGAGSYYWKSWHYLNANSAWQPIPACDGMTECTRYVAVGSPSFTIKAIVASRIWVQYDSRFAYPHYADSILTVTGPVTVRQPLAVSIAGPQNLNSSSTVCTWTASSNGTPPFAYSWTGRLSGTSASVTGSISRNGNLFLQVTDANGNYGNAQLPIEIYGGHPAGCNN